VNEMDLQATRQSITDYIRNATLDNRVIDVLLLSNEFIPKECELWDYKRDIGKDAVSLAKTILQIVSFHNTYGGYLIYGVDEVEPDTKFMPYGVGKNDLDLKQLKDKLRDYTGRQIDISYRGLPLIVEGVQYIIGLLHIPKRQHGGLPVDFGKNGPEIDKKGCLFLQDQVYFRYQDECIVAKLKEDWQLVNGERDNPFLWGTKSPTCFGSRNAIVVNHNLPDKNFICPKFVGRDLILQELWSWLADELINSMVLAGDGGKGKTSIAYEFAKDVCTTKPYDVEKVIWLTAKQKQFVAGQNEFVRVPETHFHDTESLLRAICSELAILDQEMEGASIAMLKKLVKDAMSTIPCLIVVDNIDTCDNDQQRMILETALQISNPRGRFLLTTRMNVLYSSASCKSVGGFEISEYRQFVEYLMHTFQGPKLERRQIETMYKTTDGSPLFTESLLRLYRTGVPINDAIKQWKGSLGSEARRAALQREVERLSMESRRVLLLSAYLQEASFTELKQATGYDNERLHMCISELQSLFLIAARPFLKREPRFGVSNNTAALVMENQQMLVPDPKALERIVTNLRRRRGSGSKKALHIKRIAAAIAQSNALVAAGDYGSAIATIESALEENKGNPDLVLAHSRYLFEEFKTSNDRAHLSMARKGFAKAEKLGQRKDMLYQLWFESEMQADDPSGGVEVANLAIKQGVPTRSEWLRKRSEAHYRLSHSLKAALDWDGAAHEMLSCAQNINQAMQASPLHQKQALLELLYQVNDEAWGSATYSKLGLTGLGDTFDVARRIIGLGDNRLISYQRLLNTTEKICSKLSEYDTLPPSKRDFYEKVLRQSGNLLDRADPYFSEEKELSTLRNRLRALIDRGGMISS